jgi:hypothetical protein
MSAQSPASLAATRIFPPAGIASKAFCNQVEEHTFHTSACYLYFHSRGEIEKYIDILVVRDDGCIFARRRKNLV